METENINFRDFMRSRHPDLFSDSSLANDYFLTQSVLEYHLDTLTSRKQEYDFENFCRRLSEKEICPNLLPQTGPLGGGDSKVDSENYPVADKIIENWYEGIPREAGIEKWAFAFSAKKQWLNKIKSDVNKIVSTGRNYHLIYFITNQFISDRKRAETEETFKKQHGIFVHILDRTWIIKSVIEHGHQEIAIESLHISVPNITERILGPLDAAREAELHELDKKFKYPRKYYGSKYLLVEDYIHAAKLARGLNRQRNIILGYFYQARRVANASTGKQQLINILYNEAWTVFWWFNDIGELNSLYDQIEPLCINSKHISDLEDLLNLWMLVYTSVRRGLLPVSTEISENRTDRLLQALGKMAKDETKPNSALHAKTLVHLIKLHISIDDSDSIRVELKGLQYCFSNIYGLVQYPIHVFVRTMTELGQFLSDYIEYDEMMDVLSSIVREREGEAQEGRLLLQRGLNKLDAGRDFESLKLLSSAREKFAKEETLPEMIQTNMLCSMAYKKMGLLWAARMEALLAVSLMLNPVRDIESLSFKSLLGTQRLISVELRLGRIECVIEWFYVCRIFAQALGAKYPKKDEIEHHLHIQDSILGILILELDLESLNNLQKLPDMLDNLGLIGTRAALLFSLGYDELLRDEGLFTKEQTTNDIHDFFLQWRDQPAMYQIPNTPILHHGETVCYSAIILGCTIEICLQNNLDCIVVAENILGALEAFLATIEYNDLVFHLSKLRMNLTQSSLVKFPGNISVNDQINEKVLDINISSAVTYRKDYSPQESRQYINLILRILSHVLSIGTMLKDTISETLDKLGKEGVFSRTLNMSPISHQLKHILGDSPRYLISEWQTEDWLTTYKLRRKEKWDKYSPRISSQDKQNPLGETDDYLASGKHTDYYIPSHINIDLWDKAGWSGIGFMFSTDGDAEPLLGIIFKNFDIGKRIFDEWQNDIGRVDEHEELRISIIEEIKPASLNYKVMIGTELDNIMKKRSISETPSFKYLVMTARIHTMEPHPDSRNLALFKEQYRKHGSYILVPCTLNEKSGFDFDIQLGIKKRQIHFRLLKDIGDNDPDIIALR